MIEYKVITKHHPAGSDPFIPEEYWTIAVKATYKNKEYGQYATTLEEPCEDTIEIISGEVKEYIKHHLIPQT